MKTWAAWVDKTGRIRVKLLPRKVSPDIIARLVQLNHDADGMAFFGAITKEVALTKARVFLGALALDFPKMKKLRARKAPVDIN